LRVGRFAQNDGYDIADVARDGILEQRNVAAGLVDRPIGGRCDRLLGPAEAVVVVFGVFLRVVQCAAAGGQEGRGEHTDNEQGRMSHSLSIPLTCSGWRTGASGRRSLPPWSSSRRRVGSGSC